MDVLKQLFQAEAPNEKVRELCSNHARALKAEQESMSPELSPGIVDNSELVARVLHSPFMCNLEGTELTPKAVDDVFNKGLSVNRLDYIGSDEEVFNSVRTLEAKWLSNPENHSKNRAYIGFAVANVGELRSIRDDGDSDDRQIVGVYDSANPDAAYHADACIIANMDDINDRYYPSKKALKNDRRIKIVKCFQQDIRQRPKE